MLVDSIGQYFQELYKMFLTLLFIVDVAAGRMDMRLKW